MLILAIASVLACNTPCRIVFPDTIPCDALHHAIQGLLNEIESAMRTAGCHQASLQIEATIPVNLLHGATHEILLKDTSSCLSQRHQIALKAAHQCKFDFEYYFDLIGAVVAGRSKCEAKLEEHRRSIIKKGENVKVIEKEVIQVPRIVAGPIVHSDPSYQYVSRPNPSYAPPRSGPPKPHSSPPTPGYLHPVPNFIPFNTVHQTVGMVPMIRTVGSRPPCKKRNWKLMPVANQPFLSNARPHAPLNYH